MNAAGQADFKIPFLDRKADEMTDRAGFSLKRRIIPDPLKEKIWN